MLPAANHYDVGLRLASTGGFDLLCEHLQTQWLENLGVEITWNQIEWGRFYDRKPEETPHMWMVGWYADYPDLHDFLRIQVVGRSWVEEPRIRPAGGGRPPLCPLAN